MPDEPSDWDPEKEKEEENLAREYLKTGKELLHEIKEAKENEKKKKKAQEEAEAELSKKLAEVQITDDALHPDLRGAPVGGTVAYRVPTRSQVMKKIEKTWADTKRLVGDAPPPIQVDVFHTLMHTTTQEDLQPEQGSPGMNKVIPEAPKPPAPAENLCPDPGRGDTLGGIRDL